MSPGQRCDEIIRLIDDSLSVHDLKTLTATATATGNGAFDRPTPGAVLWSFLEFTARNRPETRESHA